MNHIENQNEYAKFQGIYDRMSSEELAARVRRFADDQTTDYDSDAMLSEAAARLGVDYNTAGPSSKGKMFFLAEPAPIAPPKNQTEIEVEKYNSIAKIVEQLEACNYECEAGPLKTNVAFIALKGMA